MSNKEIDVENKSTQPVLAYELALASDSPSRDANVSEKSLTVENAAGGSKTEELVYRLYKRRFAGLVALVSSGTLR